MICADCEVGYSRTGNYECSKCPDPFLNVARLLFIFLIAIVVILFLIRSTLKGAVEKKNVTSIYSKILMNHLQLLLLTASFDFEWPEKIESFFAISEPVAEVSTQILSFDCFLDTRTSSDTNAEDSFFRVYY